MFADDVPNRLLYYGLWIRTFCRVKECNILISTVHITPVKNASCTAVLFWKVGTRHSRLLVITVHARTTLELNHILLQCAAGKALSVCKHACKSQIPLRYPGRRQVRSWLQISS